ncbi:MAG: hypothetical protein E7673_02920 [Ruminococcaceae bacterium]|nr:hypothetical protein [Oscillospiraceae bacterium]
MLKKIIKISLIFLTALTILALILGFVGSFSVEEKNSDGPGEEPEEIISPVAISPDGYWIIDGVKTEYRAVGLDGKDGADGQDGKDGTNGTDGADGADGKDGTNGTDGLTPYIKDGYWWIGDTNLNVKAEGVDGEDGRDGKDGTNGTDGKDGTNGTDGLTPYIKDGYWWIGDMNLNVKAEGVDGEDGQDGKDGTNGTDGKDGTNGTDGKTPTFKLENGNLYVSYDNGSSWSDLGRVQGADGEDGKDAVELCEHRDANDDGLCDKCGMSYEDGEDDLTAQYTLYFMVDDDVYHTCTVTAQSVVTFPEAPYKSGYVFIGWYYNENGVTKQFYSNTLLSLRLTRDLTLKAVFSTNEDYYSGQVGAEGSYPKISEIVKVNVPGNISSEVQTFTIKRLDVDLDVLYYTDGFYGDNCSIQRNDVYYMIPLTTTARDSYLYEVKIFFNSAYYNAYKEDIRASYGQVGFDDANCCVIISYHSNEEIDSSVVTDYIMGDIPRSWIKSMEIYTATEE